MTLFSRHIWVYIEITQLNMQRLIHDLLCPTRELGFNQPRFPVLEIFLIYCRDDLGLFFIYSSTVRLSIIRIRIGSILPLCCLSPFLFWRHALSKLSYIVLPMIIFVNYLWNTDRWLRSHFQCLLNYTFCESKISHYMRRATISIILSSLWGKAIRSLLSTHGDMFIMIKDSFKFFFLLPR